MLDVVCRQLVDHLEACRDVVLDHGLWRRDERDAWKKTVEQAGGRWQLVYLPADRAELLRRLDERRASPGPLP